MMGFSLFDHNPRRITVIEGTRGGVNQTTGDYIPPSETERDIEAAFDIVTREDQTFESRDESGSLVEGDARIFTKETLELGDRIRVYMDDGNTVFHQYRIKGLTSSFPFLHQHLKDDRKEYVLSKEEDPQ